MILVTGGAGFIGSHLVERLLKEGARVRVLDDFSSGHEANLEPWLADIDLIHGSITDPDIVGRAMRGVDTVFHEAAVPSVPRSFDEPLAVHHANATGTLVLLEEARRAEIRRFVFAGSSAVYGEKDQAVSEDDPLRPLSPYGAQKLLGEHYLKTYAHNFGLSTVILRYFNVFGPRQDPSSPYSGVISLFCERLIQGKPVQIHGDGGQTRDFTYVENVVQGNLLAARADLAPGTVLNVATGSQTSISELFAAVRGHLGVEGEPEHTESRAGDIRHSLADIGRARRTLGYEPRVDFRAGLERTVDWYQAALRC